MPDISIDRTTYIKIGNSDPLTTGIADGTMLIDRVLFAQDFLFGQFASSMFEIQIYGIANVAGQKIEVYQKENDIRTDLFVGQIESSKLDNAGYYRDIIAYDKFYFIAKKNVADWFNSLWTNNTEISVLDAYKSLLAHFDIDYDSNTVIAANFSGTLHKDSVVSFEKISFKDMVKYLLEPLGLIPYINESGKGAVFSPSMANAVDLSGKYDVNQSVFEEFTVKPMQWVGIQNIDSAVLQQTEITGNTSDIRYDLPYNPIRLDLYVEDGETARTAVLTNFTNKANFTEYKPCEVFMIVSDMSIKLGDQITTTRGTAYVSEIILSGPMLVEQQLISRGSQVQQEVEEEYDPVFAYLDNKVTQATEDLQEQIDNFEPSEAYLEKVNEFSSTVAAGMGLKTIKRIQDGATITYFYAPDANGAITNSKFVFVMKSNGFFWTNEWKGNADASSEGTTVWGQGIGSDGSSLLKILNAYKISADIIDTGELAIYDNNTTPPTLIHKFSFTDKSAIIGGGYENGGISYDPVNGTRIGSSVKIGGTATIGDTITDEVEKAVDDLDIKGIDRETIEYQSGTSATTVPTGTWLSSPPSVSAGRYLWTRKITYYSDGTDNSNAPLYTVARQGSNGTSVSISSIQYGTSNSASTTPTNYSTTVPTSLTKGTWLWTKTTYNNNSTAITKTYIGTDGIDGTSVTVSTPTKVGDTTTFTLTDKNGTKEVSIKDGTDGIDGVQGEPGADGKTSYVHFAWADSITFDAQGHYAGNTGFDKQDSANKKWIGTYSDFKLSDSNNPEDYSWTLIKGADGQNGTDGKGIYNTVIRYGIGSDGIHSSSVSSWDSTIPDTSATENKGKYLWTRTQIYYTTAPSVVGNTSYSVSYIAANGSAGRGISSITQYYYASTSDQSSSLPAQMSGTSVNTAWKTLPSDLSNKFSETNKYLWTFVRTIYTESNGSTTGSNGSPYIVGTWGEKGDPGSGGSGTAGRGIRNVEKQYILKDQDGNPRSVDGTPTTWSTEPPEYAGNEETEQTVTQSLTFSNAPGKPSSDSSAWSTVAKIQFIPPVTAQYVFASNAQESGSYLDTYGYLFNSSGSLIDSNDDGVSSSSRQFKITATLDAGTTYYLGAAFYSSTNAGKTIPATITYTEKTTKTYDYWERDVFTWTAAPITTYVPSESGVKSAGVSVAIRAVNELNADYAHLIIKPKDTTYIDGAKIYTGSVTASDIAAYNALIKNLMAHQVDVDGDININSPALDTSGITVSQNDVAYELYGKSFSELTTIEKNFVLVSVVLRKTELAALEQSKLKVTDNTNWKTVIVPKGLYSSNQGETKASHYGYDAEIYGDLIVHGTIYESGRTSFKNLTSSYNGAYCASGTINFSKKYTEVPEVQLTTQSLYPTFAVVEAVSTKDFTYRIYTTLNSASATAALNYLVIP